MHNEYVIDTSITPLTAIGGDMPFTPDDMFEIGDCYEIPFHVRQEAAQAASFRTGYTWPDELRRLPDGVEVCVSRLYTWLHFGQNMNVVRRRYIALRVDDQRACRAHWLALGHHYGQQAPIPSFEIGMWYNEFMNMYTGNPAQGFVPINLEPYHVRHEHLPALRPE